MLTAKPLIRIDFGSFVRKAFRHAHDGEKLGDDPYIDFLCHELEQVARKKRRRMIVNLPPRHLKTFLGSVCLAAWILGRRPATRIMIVTYNEKLAEDIAYRVRDIMQTDWYERAFETRLAGDRNRVNDFVTRQHGGVFAASVDGAITGHGGDVIIFDDPLDMKDANNLEQIQHVNQSFDSMVMSRLNNAKKGIVVVIAHRLNKTDLSGHLDDEGGWRHIVLPMIATRTRKYDLGYDTWKREKGTLLRPDAFSSKEIKRLEKSLAPDFETLYQQNPGGRGSLALKRSYFLNYNPSSLPFDGRMVLSIDPSQRSGPANSFSTIQAWCWSGRDHYLVDQWRSQCNFEALRSAYWRFVRKYRPVVALIEATAMGPHLITEARHSAGVQVLEIIPDGRSKADRLAAHLATIRRHHIHLPDIAEVREPFIVECLEFPTGKFDDQIDALTQYLDWVSTAPILLAPTQRAIGGRAPLWGLPLAMPFYTTPTGFGAQTRGGVAVFARRR